MTGQELRTVALKQAVQKYRVDDNGTRAAAEIIADATTFERYLTGHAEPPVVRTDNVQAVQPWA